MARSKAGDIRVQLAALFERVPVVVWHDEGGEFSEMAHDAAFAEALSAVVVTADDGEFALKCRVNALAPGERLLVYRVCPRPEAHGDWLADAESFAASFSADGTSLLLAKLGAANTPEMRTAAKRYSAFLTHAAMRHRVAVLAPEAGFAGSHELDLAVMLAALDENAPLEPAEVVAVYLTSAFAALLTKEGSDAEDAAWGALTTAGAGGRFAAMLGSLAGIEGDVCDDGRATYRSHAVRIAAEVLRRATDWRVRGDVAHTRDEFCYRVLIAWRRRADRTAYAEACTESFGSRTSLSFEQALNQDVCWQAEELIVGKLLRRVTALSCDVGKVLACAANRRASWWYDDFEDYYRVAEGIACMRVFRDAHTAGFSGTALGLWDAYQHELFRMDQWYRHVRAAAGRCLLAEKGNLDEALRPALTWAENLYKGWYLQQLGEAWDAAVSSGYRERGCVPGIDRADGFYALYAQRLRGRSACATVIISDALRFEVAEELGRALEREVRGTVELRAQAAPFPSITPLGMAVLLPHARLRISDDAKDVEADGISSSGLAQREIILRDAAHQGIPGATVLSASDFLQKSAKERHVLGRRAGLVYLYHNVIDEMGERDEDRLPAACEDAVSELVCLVRACVRSFGPNVIVTADHGFVYTATPLDSLDKVGKDEVSGVVTCVTHRRAVLARAPASSETLLPVSLSPMGRDDLVGFTPRGYLRVKQPGAGDRFVHGGISLQEVCVPVLRFHATSKRSRNYDAAGPATVSLLSSGRIVSDLQPVIAFHQDAPVDGKVLPAIYRARFETGEGEPASDEHDLHVDRAEVDGEAGTIRIRFSMLGGLGDAIEGVYLVLCDANSGSSILRERFTLALPARGSQPQAW